MKPEIKQLWVEALKSGKYQQGRRSMRTISSNRFCCLGVLCDVYREKTGDADWVPETSTDEYLFEGNGCFLPLAVQRWAGLRSENPFLGRAPASRQNDFCGKSFTEIADLIQKHL